MSTATTPMTPEALAPLEMPGGTVARVPSLDELRRLTEVPDRRVVFRGVDWAFYEQAGGLDPGAEQYPRRLRRKGSRDHGEGAGS